MNTWTTVILGFVGGVVFSGLVVVALFVGGLVYIQKASADNVKRQAEARAAGAAFGRTTDQEGCITKTLDLAERFADMDASSGFVTECLRESRLTANFCDGVPPPVSDYNWAKDQCRSIGRDTKLCEVAYYGKKNFCQERSKK